ncbi:MAG: ComF family protein [Alphaproteobacteria bacterium]|nr:ComF family protein [Alphaproteobacteria bacterium]
MKHFLNKLLNLVLPPVCPVCKEPVSENTTLCSKCFKSLKFITEPCCRVCGRPFPFDILGDHICAKCLSSPPLFEKARSVVIYDDMARKLILPFKHGDRLDLSPLFVKMMANTGAQLIQSSDLIVPVPLHRLRLLKRKYNQSALLAQGLAKHFHKEYIPDALQRIRFTPKQGKLSPEQRKKNVANAFRVKPHLSIQDKSILLIDDVLTTGATANECAKILLKAGATKVCLLTFATTVPGWEK